MFALKKATDKYIGKDIPTKRIVFRQAIEATKRYVKEKGLTKSETNNLKEKSLEKGEVVDLKLIVWLFEGGRLNDKEISQQIHKSIKWVVSVSDNLQGKNEEVDVLNLSFADMLNLTDVAYKHKKGEVLHQVDYDREKALRADTYRLLSGTPKMTIRDKDIDELLDVVNEAIELRKMERGV